MSLAFPRGGGAPKQGGSGEGRSSPRSIPGSFISEAQERRITPPSVQNEGESVREIREIQDGRYADAALYLLRLIHKITISWHCNL